MGANGKVGYNMDLSPEFGMGVEWRANFVQHKKIFGKNPFPVHSINLRPYYNFNPGHTFYLLVGQQVTQYVSILEKFTPVFGGGYEYQWQDNLSFNFDVTRQKYKYRFDKAVPILHYSRINKQKSILDMISLSMNYYF